LSKFHSTNTTNTHIPDHRDCLTDQRGMDAACPSI